MVLKEFKFLSKQKSSGFSNDIKVYTDCINMNEKALEAYKKVKIDDPKELVTYEMSSKLEVSRRYNTFLVGQDFINRQIIDIFKFYKAITNDANNNNGGFNQKAVSMLKDLVDKTNKFIQEYEKGENKNKKKKSIKVYMSYGKVASSNLVAVNKKLEDQVKITTTLHENFDTVFNTNIPQISNGEIKKVLLKSLLVLRKTLEVISKDERNLLIRISKQKGVNFDK